MTMLDEDEVENTPDLSISPEKVCYLEGRGYWRGDSWTDF
jgi:hypothetical protein